MRFLKYPTARKLQIIGAYIVALPNAYVYRETMTNFNSRLIKRTALTPD